MNPPYCRNLHLKILNEAVMHSDGVCIHPARWLEDALWKEKSSSDRNKFSRLVDHIDSIILLNSKSFGDEDCCKLFNLDDEQTDFICNTLKTHSMKEFINYESYK